MNKQPKIEPSFVPMEPTEPIKKFIKEKPDAKWKDVLDFLLDRFPQMADGQIQYLVDGGAAVSLLHPEREEPLDVDILVRSEKFSDNFANAKIIDAKTVKDWCSNHNIPYGNEIDEKIFTLGTTINFNDKTVFIVTPEFLALSKSIPWRGRPQERAKDKNDLKLLSVSDDAVQRLKKVLGIQG